MKSLLLLPSASGVGTNACTAGDGKSLNDGESCIPPAHHHATTLVKAETHPCATLAAAPALVCSAAAAALAYINVSSSAVDFLRSFAMAASAASHSTLAFSSALVLACSWPSVLVLSR
ncbi:uncharacterized protein CCR75_007733 [Bremia lactucae]|uniref:Uncharacterized protein n=1 Tax=Bremia lactucae TaxID=4779 RepID=A0A976IJ92_BRELC|nr:hypothetical protein CCR75_007733 [Bremia lactucae]